MNKPSLAKFQDKLKKGGRLFINSSLVKDVPIREGVEVYEVPVNDIAIQLGNAKVANMVMMGAYLKVTGIFEDKDIIAVLKEKFVGEKAHLIDINKEALKEGAARVTL
jgi:2-oxoglutarate ferredoxin oxidoreductase subunit gamma